MNSVQELQFALMEKASFNDFDGAAVVASLQTNPELWVGAVMDRDDLIKLRDIADDYWSVDTLYIIPREGRETELELLAHKWNADEINWLAGAVAQSMLGYYNGNKDTRILRVWWD